MTGKNLYSSQLINYFIWTTTKSYNNKVDQAHVYLTHFSTLKYVCIAPQSLFPRFMRTQPAIASLSIIFYYSRGIPRNDHIIGERATHNASSTNHDVFPNVVPFNMMEFAPRKQLSPITTGRFFRRSSRSTG